MGRCGTHRLDQEPFVAVVRQRALGLASPDPSSAEHFDARFARDLAEIRDRLQAMHVTRDRGTPNHARAASLLWGDQAEFLETAHGFAHGMVADVVLRTKLSLARQKRSDLILPALDRTGDLISDDGISRL